MASRRKKPRLKEKTTNNTNSSQPARKGLSVVVGVNLWGSLGEKDV